MNNYVRLLYDTTTVKNTLFEDENRRAWAFQFSFRTEVLLHTGSIDIIICSSYSKLAAWLF